MLRLASFALVLALVAAGPAVALESAPAASSRDTVTLVSDTDAVAPGTPFRVGLHFRLAPGWHTYWRNPGDAGVAPELDLALPQGATAGPIAWPAPQPRRRGAGDDLRLHRRGAAAGDGDPGRQAGADRRSSRTRAGWSARRSACRSRPTSASTCRPGHAAPSAAGAAVRRA